MLCESGVSGRVRWGLGGGSHSSGRDDQLAVVDEDVNGWSGGAVMHMMSVTWSQHHGDVPTSAEQGVREEGRWGEECEECWVSISGEGRGSVTTRLSANPVAGPLSARPR